MKRFLHLLFAAFLFLGFPLESYGQTWNQLVETREIVHIIRSFESDIAVLTDTTEYMAVVPKLSPAEQFPKGSAKVPEEMEGVFSENSEALIQLAKKADEIVIFGLQDETGSYIDGLGEQRARAVARQLNELLWHSQAPSLKVTTQEYSLGNAAKEGILREHQQYLNQRGIAIVAYFDKDTHTDISWFNWVLLLLIIGAIALAALILSALAWSQRNNSTNDNHRQTNGSSAEQPDPEEDEIQGNEPTEDNAEPDANSIASPDRHGGNINIFLYQEIQNEGDGNISVDPPDVFLADHGQ